MSAAESFHDIAAANARAVMIGTDITDITWAAMTAAGIDTDHVHRRVTEDGAGEYILVEGDIKVAFGPAIDVESDGTDGYAICCYEHAGDAQWDEVRQDWAETVDDLLRLVAAVVSPTSGRLMVAAGQVIPDRQAGQ